MSPVVKSNTPGVVRSKSGIMSLIHMCASKNQNILLLYSNNMRIRRYKTKNEFLKTGFFCQGLDKKNRPELLLS